MGARSVITLTTGPAGSGKTYVRCARFLVDEWLPGRDGVHYSNFPVFREKVAEHAARKAGKSAADYLERIQLIPKDALDSWVQGSSGPWDYFRDKNLDGAHIAIDECHNFCGRKTHHEVRARWQAWLGEIRHQGATVEFLSQSPEKVAKEIHYEAGLRLSLVNSEDRRDPFLGILLGDWYELRAGFITGEYETTVWEVERRSVDGRWIEQNKRVFTLDPFYFQFYDSFSAPVQGGHKAGGQQREFQKHGRAGVLWWFTCRNAWCVVPRAVLVGIIGYLCMGGSTTVIQAFTAFMQRMAANNAPPPAKVIAPPKPAPKPSVPSGKSAGLIIPAPPPVVLPQTPEIKAASKEPERPAPPSAPSPIKKRSTLVLLTERSAALDDGRVIHVGESIGATQLQSVDLVRRCAVLGTGQRVRIGETLELD